MERDGLPEVVRTKRLTLRPFGLGDVEDVLAYARDPEWSRFLRDLPQPYGPAEAEQGVVFLAIAASALVWRCPLWTLNVSDFTDVPELKLVR